LSREVFGLEGGSERSHVARDPIGQQTTLKAAAMDAFAQGIGWGEFWAMHGELVLRVASAGNDDRLVEQLLSLVVSGDMVGLEHLDDEGEFADSVDVFGLSDAITQARCRWPDESRTLPSSWADTRCMVSLIRDVERKVLCV